MFNQSLVVRERRVLECLRSTNQKTLKEVTTEYNKRYPPSCINKKIGIKVEERDIQSTLSDLVEQQLVSKQLLSYYDRPLRVPTNYFTLTSKGIQALKGKG